MLIHILKKHLQSGLDCFKKHLKGLFIYLFIYRLTDLVIV